MSESVTSQSNPFIEVISPEEMGILRGLYESNRLSDDTANQLNEWRNVLLAEGETAMADEYAVAWMRRQFGNEHIVEGLRRIEAERGVSATEFIKHSYRYSEWHGYPGTRFEDVYEADVNEVLGFVALQEGPHNLMKDGSMRRHEEGHLVSLNVVRRDGIDPSKVLFYRVTQPAHDGPKPEYYWTSDSLEVQRGLTRELGTQAKTAIILVSTLEEIAQDGGLIDDMNDDEGHAVRRVNLGSYDQNRALFTYSRTRENQ